MYYVIVKDTYAGVTKLYVDTGIVKMEIHVSKKMVEIEKAIETYRESDKNANRHRCATLVEIATMFS